MEHVMSSVPDYKSLTLEMGIPIFWVECLKVHELLPIWSGVMKILICYHTCMYISLSLYV